jgi:hypothetical protein
MGNAEFDRFREQLEAVLNEDPSYRAMKPVDMSWPVGYLRVDPGSGIAAGIDVVTSEGVRPMVWLPKWRYIVARFDGPGYTWDIDFDTAEWAVIRPGHYVGSPIVDGYLVTSLAVFGADVPTPPGRVDAPGTASARSWTARTDQPAGCCSTATPTTSATPARVASRSAKSTLRPASGRISTPTRPADLYQSGGGPLTLGRDR